MSEKLDHLIVDYKIVVGEPDYKESFEERVNSLLHEGYQLKGDCFTCKGRHYDKICQTLILTKFISPLK
jgi:hypothetical protein